MNILTESKNPLKAWSEWSIPCRHSNGSFEGLRDPVRRPGRKELNEHNDGIEKTPGRRRVNGTSPSGADRPAFQRALRSRKKTREKGVD